MKFNLPIRKSWGQNFLTDSNTIDKIIDIISPKKNETILEIGPGYGFMTDFILKNKNTIKMISERIKAKRLKQKQNLQKTKMFDTFFVFWTKNKKC